MLRILFIVLFVALITESSGCPDGWTFYKGDRTCLKFFNQKWLTWSKARESCQSFGGDLVIIRDEVKNNFVFEMYIGSRWGPWIGVKNQASVGLNFTYVDGTALGCHQPWGPDQPDGQKDTDHKCVDMSGFKPHDGKWWDIECSRKRPYVCST